MLQRFALGTNELSTRMPDTEIQRFNGPWIVRRVENLSTHDDCVPKGLFDDDVVVESVDPSLVSLDNIDPQERQLVVSAIESRQREFAAGRLCARRAHTRLGISDKPVLADADRQPRWPEGIAGSISHVSGICGVAVARRAHVAGIGLDIELSIDLPADASQIVLTEWERSMLSLFSERERGRRARLVFSAKEAFYKCYRSAGGGWLDFHEVELRSTPDADEIELRLAKSRHMNAVRIDGRYALTPRFIFTAFTAR